MGVANAGADFVDLQRLDSSETEGRVEMEAILAIVGFLVFVLIVMYIDHRRARHPRKTH